MKLFPSLIGEEFCVVFLLISVGLGHYSLLYNVHFIFLDFKYLYQLLWSNITLLVHVRKLRVNKIQLLIMVKRPEFLLISHLVHHFCLILWNSWAYPIWHDKVCIACRWWWIKLKVLLLWLNLLGSVSLLLINIQLIHRWLINAIVNLLHSRHRSFTHAKCFVVL